MKLHRFYSLMLPLLFLPLLAVSTRADSILQTAGSFAVLAGGATTNTGSTTITGDYGVSPGSSLDMSGITLNGAPHPTDAVAAQAQIDLTTAYNALNALTPTTIGSELSGQTLTAGVYNFASTAALLSGGAPLTLDFAGQNNAAIIFQIGSTLTTASGPNGGPLDASVVIESPGSNDAVYWVVGTATIGTYTQFEGNILSLAGIALETGATIGCGRALNQTPGPVTMDTNTISIGCSGNLAGSNGLSGSGNTITVPLPGGGTQTATVPEPSTLLLLGTGIVGMFSKARSRRPTPRKA